MNHINRHSLMATLLATCCFCSTTLLGGLDNIWYTYEIFLTKKPATQATTIETVETEEAKQPKPQVLIEAPYGHLSTIHGLAAIEMGVIRHIYDNAPMFNMKEAEKIAHTKAEEEVAKLAKARAEQQAAVEAKEAAPAVEQKPAAITVQRLTNTILHKLIARHIGLPPAKGDVPAAEGKEAKQPAKQPDGMAIVRLVHTIFHRQDPTQLTQGDFVITDQLKNCTKDTIAEFVGLLLATIEQGRKGQPDWKKAQFTTKSLNGWINELDETNLKDESKEKICKGLATQAEKDTAIENAVKYSRLTLQNTVNFAIEACKPEYLAKSPFPPETVYLILLGLLYQHTGLDATSLKTYYRALADRYSRLDGIFKSFEKVISTLKKAVLPKTATDVTKLKKNLVSAAQQYTTVTDDAIAFIHKDYEEFVFLSLLPGLLPPDFNYADSTLTVFTVETNTFTRTGPVITDCMDSVMRKICNVLALNTKTGIFSVPMLTCHQWDVEGEKTEDEEKKQTEASTIHPAIKAFYTKHQSPNHVGNLDAHSDWLAVISNIPYVAYANKRGSDVYQNWPGYINIPAADTKANDALAKFVMDRGYVVVQDKDAMLYEIQPSIRNIIIALNYLLNLNLFNGALAKVFADPAFVKTYLPKLSQALNLELDIKQSDNLETIDDQDLKGSEHIIVMGLPNKPAQFRITITRGHGAFKPLEAQKSLSLPIFQEALARPNRLPSSALFFHGSKTPSICSLKDPKSIYLSLFATELDNPDAVSHISESTCLLASEDVLKLLLYCVDRHPDPVQRAKSKFDLYHTYCHGKSIDTLLTEEMYKQALDVVETNYDSIGNGKAGALLKELSLSKKYIQSFLDYQCSLLSQSDIDIWLVTKLFEINATLQNKPLAQKIYDYVLGLVAAAKHGDDESRTKHKEMALFLLEHFADSKEYADVFIKNFSSIYQEHPSEYLTEGTKPLLLGYPKLFNLFTTNTDKFDTKAIEPALKKLCAYTKGAMTLKAQSNYQATEAAAYIKLMHFLQTLVEHGFKGIYDDVMQIAVQRPNQEFPTVNQAANQLLTALIKQDHGLKEIAADEDLLCYRLFDVGADWQYHQTALETLNALITKDYCIDNITNEFVKNLNIIMKGSGYSRYNVEDRDNIQQLIKHRIDVFTPLFEHKSAYAFKRATEEAQKLWKKEAPSWFNSDAAEKYQIRALFLKQEAFELFKLLFTYNLGVTEALSVATETLRQIEAFNQLLRKKQEAIQDESKKWEAWFEKDVKDALHQFFGETNYVCRYGTNERDHWLSEKDVASYLDQVYALAGSLLEAAKKVQSAQAESANAAKASSAPVDSKEAKKVERKQ